MFSMRLDRVLKRLRAERDLTMQALATRAGVTDAYIAQLETGVRKNPSLAVLKRLAKALGVTLAELVE